MQKKWICFILVFGLFTLSPISAQITSYPDRIYGDTLYAPFYHGVASGDPLDTAVIIWTRVTPGPSDTLSINVHWEVSLDSNFSALVNSGAVITDSSSDWTVKVDVGALGPGNIYYYRFDNGLGQYSRLGRTRTAPTGSVSDLRMAVFSCSSIYSGYFNAYKRVAERWNSLNVAIHLGDYLYDFVDSDEEIRVPLPYPTVPQSLEEWRDRHDYYLLDPDLRDAKAYLPWIILWDNHDTEWGSNDTCYVSAGTKAFLEWTPIRVPDTMDQLKIYRSFSYGNLADIFISDVLMYRHVDTLANGEDNILGNAQYQWLTMGLSNSSAKWKIIGNQRMMGGWYTNGIAQWILDMVPHDSLVFDLKSWDGFPESRHQLFDFWRNNSIDNVIVLSGDAHVSLAMDLVESPNNMAEYNPITGAGSVGVEFLPTSITRGNMDESGAPLAAFDLINSIDRLANPQHQLADLFNHGFGYLHLKTDSTIAQIWYSNKLSIETADSAGPILVVKDGENHWSRQSGYSAMDSYNQTDNITVFPNPTFDKLWVKAINAPPSPSKIEVINLMGETLYTFQASLNTTPVLIDVENLPAGVYVLRVDGIHSLKFIKQPS